MKKLLSSIFLLTSTSVYAYSDYRFSNSYSTYKEALLNSLSNRTKEIESTCISKQMVKDEESGKVLENTFVSTSTYKEFYSIDNKVITVISNSESADGDVPSSTSQTTYTMKDENTLVLEVISSYYYKDENGKIISNNNSFYIEEKIENGLVKEVVSYKKNGEEVPHTWEKHKLLKDPFGVEFTRVIINRDPSKLPRPEGAQIPYYSVNTCYEKELGVDNYKDLYKDYVVGDWKVADEGNEEFNISINKDGTYNSNIGMILNGTWSIDKDYNLLLKRNEDLFKYIIEFSNFSGMYIQHVEYGKDENYVGSFNLKK